MPDLSEVRSYRIWKQLIENAAAKSATANLDSPISDVPLLRLEAALRFLATVESKRRASGVLQGISLAKGEDGDQEYQGIVTASETRGIRRNRESQMMLPGAQSTGNTCTFRNLQEPIGRGHGRHIGIIVFRCPA
jgi:hypothetical protein